MSHKTFSLQEAAEYLHIRPDELRELVRHHEVPFSRRGDRILFQRTEIDAWASQRILGFSHAHLHDYHRRSSARHHDLSARHHLMPELMEEQGVDPAMTSKTRASLIRSMTALAVRTGHVIYEEELLDMIEEREKMCSTALSGGFAMLHPPHHDPYMFDDSFMVLGRTIQPIPFGSPDGRTTNLFFLICCQDDRIHLHVLARLSSMCRNTDLAFQLNNAETAGELYAAVLKAEDEVIRAMQ